MPISFPSRPPASLRRSGAAKKPTPTTPSSNWRCIRCGSLLGVVLDDRLHVSFARGHEYLSGFPVEARCRTCGTLNHTTGPAR